MTDDRTRLSGRAIRRATEPTCAPWPTGCSARRARWTTPFRRRGCGSAAPIPTGIDNLGGWLTTVVARVCLDMLRSRKSRREEPFDPQAPEPIATGPSGSSPEHEAVLADSVGLALLVVLDRLTPAERLAFVLHDMFAVPFEEIAPIVGRSADGDAPARQPCAAPRARRRGSVRARSRSAARGRRCLSDGVTRRRLRRPARRPRSGSRGSRGHGGAARRPRSVARQSGRRGLSPMGTSRGSCGPRS